MGWNAMKKRQWKTHTRADDMGYDSDDEFFSSDTNGLDWTMCLMPGSGMLWFDIAGTQANWRRLVRPLLDDILDATGGASAWLTYDDRDLVESIWLRWRYTERMPLVTVWLLDQTDRWPPARAYRFLRDDLDFDEATCGIAIETGITCLLGRCICGAPDDRDRAQIRASVQILVHRTGMLDPAQFGTYDEVVSCGLHYVLSRDEWEAVRAEPHMTSNRCTLCSHNMTQVVFTGVPSGCDVGVVPRWSPSENALVRRTTARFATVYPQRGHFGSTRGLFTFPVPDVGEGFVADPALLPPAATRIGKRDDLTREVERYRAPKRVNTASKNAFLYAVALMRTDNAKAWAKQIWTGGSLHSGNATQPSEDCVASTGRRQRRNKRQRAKARAAKQATPINGDTISCPYE